MSYTPTEWNSGDIITAEKLNKLEDGVADANDVNVGSNNVLKIDMNLSTTGGEYVLTMDLAECNYDNILSAINSGCLVYVALKRTAVQGTFIYYLSAHPIGSGPSALIFQNIDSAKLRTIEITSSDELLYAENDMNLSTTGK